MMELNQAIFQELRANQPEIYAKIYEFYFLPAGYLHPSRRNSFFNGELPDHVWTTKRVWPRLSTIMLSELNLSFDIHFSPMKKKEIFVYFSWEKMQRLAQQLGAILLGSKIRACLVRKEVLIWKERLGVEVFNFVMNRSNFFPKIKNDDIPSGVDDVEKIGYGLIAQCLENLPDHVKKRAYLKLHSQFILTEVASHTANQLLQSVTLLMESEWVSLLDRTKNSAA